jgi:hypothetical protein
MIDAVISYHANEMTCGVTKYNRQLAERIGVPHDQLNHADRYQHPLLSVKFSELMTIKHQVELPRHFSILWHDRAPGQRYIDHWASDVFYADEIGCPSTVRGDATRGTYRVLAFGMAHKLALSHFERLKLELERDHPDYTIELSTAVHEGHPWDQALRETTESMRAIFGSRLRVLGFLADDALARVLQEVDAVAAFYEPAFRANNTSGWAAVAAGKTFYTNRDAQSPTVMPTWESVIDVLSADRMACRSRLDDSLTVSR